MYPIRSRSKPETVHSLSGAHSGGCLSQQLNSKPQNRHHRVALERELAAGHVVRPWDPMGYMNETTQYCQ
jgi:hypothetical protein